MRVCECAHSTRSAISLLVVAAVDEAELALLPTSTKTPAVPGGAA